MAKVLTTTVLVIAVAVWFFRRWEHGPLPNLNPEEWWGPKELKGISDTSVRKFRVEFSEEMIADLRRRLNNFRAPRPSLDGIGFQYGFNSKQLDSWKVYWAEKYNFTEREKFLNKFPNYKTNVQGLDIHFIWVKPEVPPGVKVLPLLILHGWPGSVREFYELIPLLTALDPGYDFVFEVIAPSLPGFGYSDAPARTGLGSPQIAVIMRNLMHRLGHKQFYIQAGDWGAEVATDLATLYPGDVLGYHSNLAIVKHPLALLTTAIGAVIPSWLAEPPLYDRMKKLPTVLLKEGAYFYLQASKPDTIGIVLSDSPLGLLAYNLEKVSVGTNYHNVNETDGGLDTFTKDQLLDNLMMYWASNSVVTSFRMYKDCFREKLNQLRFNFHPTPVPTWVMQTEYEILYQLPYALRFKFPNLVNVTVLYEGGHFIALEAPKVLATDVFTAVNAFRTIEKNKLLL